MRILEYRHNGGTDWVLLVDTETGFVRSDWRVTPDVLRDFCDCLQHPDNWDDREGEEHKPEDYGEQVAIREGYTLESVRDSRWRERVEFHSR